MQHYTSSVIDTLGNAISGATINVYAAGTTTPSTIYSDNILTGASNPLTSGADGSYDFYAADGRYDLLITHPGHTFSAADTAGISLSDPLSGDWTPALGGTATYTLQLGTYTKIGRQVTVYGVLTVNAIGTGSTTLISGLPFDIEASGVGAVYWSGAASSVTTVVAICANTTDVAFYSRLSAGTSLSANAIFTSGTSVTFSLTYYTLE